MNNMVKIPSFRQLLCLALVVMVGLTSCRKDSEFEDMVNPNNRVCKTYLQQFDAVWNGMSQGYVFWGRDSVDWDFRYEQYKPIFEAFDARPASQPVTQAEYQQAYEGLFEGLLDHHLYGKFCVPKGKFEAIVNPGKNDYVHDTWAGYERAVQLQVLQSRADLVPGSYCAYEPEDYGDFEIPGTYFALLKVSPGKMIAYFRFTNFYLYNIFYYREALQRAESAQTPLRKFYGSRYWEGISSLTGYANNDSVVGLILDLRGNTGGHTSDLEPFIGSLAQTPTQVGYTRVKDGFGRLDYSPWSEYTINCPQRHLQEQKPIVVLSDINSVSCAELATLLIKNLPNGTFIGERTYGAVGALLARSDVSHDNFYSGCFGDYDYFKYDKEIYRYKEIFGYYVYTSTYHMVDKDYNDIEGIGVPPDIEVKYDMHGLMYNHVDNQMDAAVDFIKGAIQ